MTPLRSAVLAGIRDASWLVVAYIPFGLAMGAAMAQTSVNPWVSFASSPVIFAGAAQLVGVQLLDAGASIALVVLTIGVVNARHLLYSASLQPHLADWSRGSRLGAAFLLADPVYALGISRFEGADGGGARRERQAYYFAAGVTAFLGWSTLTAVGLTLGQLVPPDLPLELAIPLTFLLLLLPMVKDRPGAVAAVVGGAVALAASPLPLGLGLILGSVAGIVVGGVVLARTQPDADPLEEVAADA